jgi:hypothetical protein
MVIAVFDIGGSHISHGFFNVALSRLIGEEGLTRSVPTNDADAMAVLVHLAIASECLVTGGEFDIVANPPLWPMSADRRGESKCKPIDRDVQRCVMVVVVRDGIEPPTWGFSVAAGNP